SPGVYADEIEKDLNRSLPEYPAYQADEGINALRRVLNAYSWKNPELGYCQAMNIVASALLIYLDEEQAFWMLSVLCDRMVPGYYSSSMYGASLDQAIFEHLVAKTMPMLDTHFKQHDIQLAVACLPWFLTLFINSMPLLFAFRVLDCFFLEGPKVLFQIGLAIFKINGGQLLKAQDDGEFMNVLKTYFGALDEPVHPDSPNPHTRQLTRFHELLYVAYRDFPFITAEMIDNLRRTHQLKIVHTVESFTKRLQLRNLPTTGRFSKQELSLLYDRFHSALYYENSLPNQPIAATRSRSIPTPHRRTASLASSVLSPESAAKAERTLTHECDQAPRATDTKPRDRSQMNYGAFKRLMASLATWAKVEEVQPNPHLVGYGPKPGAADRQTVSQRSSVTSSPHTPGSQLLTDQAKMPLESQSPNTPTQQGDHHLPSPTKASATSSSPLPLHIASNAGLPTIRRVASRRDAGDWFLSRLFIHFWHRTQNDPLLRSSSTDMLQSPLVASISSTNSPTTEQPVDSSASSQPPSGNPLSPAADNTAKADRGASDSEAEAEAVGITDDMTLSLAAVVSQLGHMLHLDMMSLMDYFFQLHDALGQGDLSREDMYQVSETLLFLFRHDSNDHYLDAVSKLLQRAIQYAEQGYFDMKVGRYVSERDVASDDNSMDSIRQSNNDTIRPGEVAASLPTSPAHPPEQGPARRPDLDKEKAELLQTTPAFALSVSAFRMLLLADELLEAYFDHGFCDTFNVTPGATAGLLGTPPPMPRHIPASASQVGRELFHSLWSGGAKLAGTVGKRMVDGLQQSRRRVESSSGPASQLTHMRSDETLEENDQPFPLGPNEPRMGPLNPPALKTASKAVAAAAAGRVATAMVHSGSTSPTDLSASIGHGGDDGHDQDVATSPDDMMEEVERLLSEMNADEENDAHYTTRAANSHSYSFSPNSHNKGLAAMTERTSPTLAGTQADDPSSRPSSPDEPFDLEDVERLLQEGDDDD
ncbi:GTPase activating protein (GAP), partial [Dimargaris xerosporica]